MPIELYVQDFFYESSSQNQFPKIEGETYISPITWSLWINDWFDFLSTDLQSSNCAIAFANTYEMGLRLTNDTEIQQLNSQYRQKHQPTDVLSFATLEDRAPQSVELDPEQEIYLGDIVVSIDTANRQAQQQGYFLADELVWLVAHGFLHLLGWDHPDDESLERMLEKQVELLHKVGIKTSIYLNYR